MEHVKDRLRRYEWPGNVRELQNVIERAFITSVDGRTLNIDRALPDSDLSKVATHVAASAEPEQLLTADDLKTLERRNIERALLIANGKISGPQGAADLLGVNANTLASRMKALGVPRQRGSS